VGDQGEPGSPSRAINRAALLSGLASAVCNCHAQPGALNLDHATDCPVSIAGERMQQILREEPG
jgi:hypothetical protein